MKTSLFKKKEITKKELGKIVGGEPPTQHEKTTIGTIQTQRYSPIFGIVSDIATDAETFTYSD